VLALLSLARGNPHPPARNASYAIPTVSVILPVYNEEKRIGAKLENVLGQNFPRGQLEVIVVSDGSTDATERIVAGYGDSVQLLRTAGRVGKSLAQNQAVARARGEIVVLTDAAVVMDADCLRNLLAPFSDERVGCASARLLFGTGNSVTGKDQGLYWNYELKLRRIESELGILATAAGPAMAIRRELWRDLPADYGDDCVLPLDVVLQGSRVVHADTALAWDEAFDTARREFRARVRMTVRNWLGTFSRRALLNPLRHPGIAFALWSHKILRWLSPCFLVAMLAGTVLIAAGGGALWPLGVLTAAFAAGAAGMFCLFRGRRLPLLASPGSLLANIAFLFGLLKVARGQTIKIYQNQ